MNKYRLSIVLVGILISLDVCLAQKHIDTTSDRKSPGKQANETGKIDVTDEGKQNSDETKEPKKQTAAADCFIDFPKYIEYLEVLNEVLDSKLNEAEKRYSLLLKQAEFKISFDFTPESFKMYLKENKYLKDLYRGLPDIKKFAESRQDITIAGCYVCILEAYGCANRLCTEDEINNAQKKLETARNEALPMHIDEIEIMASQIRSYMFAFYELGRLVRLVDEGKDDRLLEDEQQVKFIKRVPYLFGILQDYIQQSDKERKETKTQLIEKLPNIFE